MAENCEKPNLPTCIHTFQQMESAVKFLRTEIGYVSTRWIVRMNQRAQGDWSVEYFDGTLQRNTLARSEDVQPLISEQELP